MARKHDTVPDLASFNRMLRFARMKSTPQRTAVHSAMMKLVHASAEEVVAHIAASGEVKITRASVYRILAELADAGIYSRRLSSDTRQYFDAVPSRHVHLYNFMDGEFQDVADPELNSLIETAMKGHRFRGYKIDGVEISILCHPSRRRLKTRK